MCRLMESTIMYICVHFNRTFTHLCSVVNKKLKTDGTALFLPLAFTLYLCLHPYFIQLLNVPPGEIYMAFKLCRTQCVVNAGSLFRGTKVIPKGKPYQSPPLQFIPREKRWTCECIISKTSSVSTCSHTAKSGRDKCDLFSGNISAIWSNSNFEVCPRISFCSLHFRTKLSTNALKQIFLITCGN